MQLSIKKKQLIIEMICILFIFLFLYTGIMKLLDHQSFEFSLGKYPIPYYLIIPVSFAVPIAEIILSVGLIFTKTRPVSLYGALALMILFTLVVGYILFFVKDKPCSCGGIISSLSFGQHLILNLSFSTLAIIGIKITRNTYKVV